MTIRNLPPSLSTVTVLTLAFFLTVVSTQLAEAQEPKETYFSGNSIAGAACPPSFPSVYWDSSHGTFFGRSNFTMSQWDEYHTYQMYTYQFTGTTTDERYRVTGIHHVNAAQCLDAAYSYWFGVPAVIAVLHVARFRNLACNRTGGTSGTLTGYEYDPYEESPPPAETCNGTGTGNGTGIQFQPGESTGGETVDWNTGKGDGGTSACGEAAVVEYICVDLYNEQTGKWDTFSCGFATSC
jgi:hypothetical protein